MTSASGKDRFSQLVSKSSDGVLSFGTLYNHHSIARGVNITAIK